MCVCERGRDRVQISNEGLVVLLVFNNKEHVWNSLFVHLLYIFPQLWVEDRRKDSTLDSSLAVCISRISPLESTAALNPALCAPISFVGQVEVVD